MKYLWYRQFLNFSAIYTVLFDLYPDIILIESTEVNYTQYDVIIYYVKYLIYTYYE